MTLDLVIAVHNAYAFYPPPGTIESTIAEPI